MASGPVDDDSRTKQHRWAERNKVHNRKHHNKSKISGNVPGQSSQTLAATTTTEVNNSSQKQQHPPQAVSQSRAAASDYSSTHNHPQPVMVAQNGHEPVIGNGTPLYARIENRVSISLNSRSKSEIRELKGKLLSELDNVRNLVKRIEAKEVQINGYSGSGRFTHSKFSASEAVDKVISDVVPVNSEVGSVVPQPFNRGLSVSLMENNHRVDEFLEKEKRTPQANPNYRNSDIVSGKEKFPQESNKKLKGDGGRKDGGEMGFGFRSPLFKSCSNLLAKLMKHKHGWVFNVPVDVKGLGLHDYHTIVKHPMDLGTVKSRLNQNWYKSPREFAEDVRVTFSNAMLYNPKEQDVHIMAKLLLNIFEEKWLAIEADCNLDRRSETRTETTLRTPTSRKDPPLPLARLPLLSARLPSPPHPNPGRIPVPKKPKTNDPDKRGMTLEEKHRLSTNLQNLPSEKLDNIVQIMKKRNPGLSQQDDEIEVDLESLDPETLSELDRFVSNYQKSLSKNKRKAELALQAKSEAGNTREANPTSAIAEVPKTEKQHNDISGSTSSSTSGSDSGSSSGDADRDSSSDISV